jgi:hypothetical protein
VTLFRIQRQRTRGWRMPEGAVYVGRPSQWGNPWELGSPGIGTQPDGSPWAIEDVLRWYRQYARECGPFWLQPLLEATALACWCPLEQPCHVDVLIPMVEARRAQLEAAA